MKRSAVLRSGAYAGPLFVLLTGCRPTETKSAAAEVVIPTLHVEAGAASYPDGKGAVADASTSGAATEGGDGWMVHSEGESAPTYTDRSVVLAEIRKAPERALLAYIETNTIDCSGVGGSHAFFTVLEPGKGAAYYGGRGWQVGGFADGGLWVASIDRLPKPISVKDSRACVPDRRIDARVRALVPVASAEEGRRLLKELARGPRGRAVRRDARADGGTSRAPWASQRARRAERHDGATRACDAHGPGATRPPRRTEVRSGSRER